MLLEMGLVAAGVPFGWLWRNSVRVIAFVGRGLTWTVRLMLFLLGLSLGQTRACWLRCVPWGCELPV